MTDRIHEALTWATIIGASFAICQIFMTLNTMKQEIKSADNSAAQALASVSRLRKAFAECRCGEAEDDNE